MEENNKTSDESPVVNCGSVLTSCGGGSAGSDDTETRVKRKRGRPRKLDPARMESHPPALVSCNFPPTSSTKRRRGRPKGSGKLQVLASLGGYFAETAGGNFCPYVLTVNAGEDIAGKVTSLIQRPPRAALCILSACGVVSRGVICQPGSPNGVLTFEGCFEILSLSGSFSCGEGVSNLQTKGMLTVSLAKPDGQVFGGVVNGSLIADGPIQLIVATFKKNIAKDIKRRYSSDSSTAASRLGDSKMAGILRNNARMADDNENPSTPTTALLELAHEVDTVTAENQYSSPPQIVDENALQTISDKGKSPDGGVVQNQSSSPASLHTINKNTLQAMQYKSDLETSLDMTIAKNKNSSSTSLHNVGDIAFQDLRPISEKGTFLDSTIVENHISRPASPHNIPLQLTSPDGVIVGKPGSNPASSLNVGENPLQILQPLSDHDTLPHTTTAENQNMSPVQNDGENALEVQQSTSYQKTSSITNVVENENLSPISPHNIGDNTLLVQKSPDPDNSMEDQNSTPASQHNGGVGENMLRIWQPIYDRRLSPEIN